METNPATTISGQELINSLSWLIRLRWLAGMAVIGLTFLTSYGLGLRVPGSPLYMVGFGLFAYNLLLSWLLAQMHHRDCSEATYQWFARVQIGLDWLAMSVLIHYSGGIASPVIIFFMFHITIASLLLPHDKGFLYVALAPMLVGAIAWLEYARWLEHVPVFEVEVYRNPVYVFGVLVFFTCAAYVMAYFSMAISRRLRRRENEIAGLYETMRATTSTLDLQEVLNRLTEATTRVLGCKAASIRLLDSTGSRLEMIASHGLSETYRDQAATFLAGSVIDRETLAGKTVLIADAWNDARVRFPERVRGEGIRSILTSPLMGKRGLMGLLRAYGTISHRFTRDDAHFLAAVAGQGANAIENAQAYRILEDLNRQKSQFVRIVTHELRSPVQVALNLLGVLSGNYLGGLNEKQLDIVRRTERRLQSLQNLVDDLLNLAAARADVMSTPERGPVVLVEVLKDLYDRFDPIARSKGLHLSMACPDSSLAVWGRREELDRLFGNLLDNALKYSFQGTVSIMVRRSHDKAVIVVTDTGIGIPQKALPKIYDEFFRAPNAKEREERGTGLGLAIVQDLVNRYDGTIGVQSTEGEGTIFTVCLPALLCPSEPLAVSGT